MSANLDRPLSDIIDESNKSNPRRGGRGGARRGGAGGPRRNNNNNNNKNAGGARNPLARDDDAQDDSQNGGGGYGPQRRGRMDTRAGPYNDDSSWKHDMYGAGAPRQIQRPSAIGFKILVSNLDNAVTVSDLQEIFAEIGPLQTNILNTDKEGRPIGTAEISFGSRAEADRALKEFDGAEVDGRPMYLKLVAAPPRVPSAQAAPAPRQNNNFVAGPRPQRGGMRSSRGGNNQSRPRGGSAGRGRGGAGGSRGGRGGRTRQPKEEVTAEALDAEMENYRKSAAGTGAAAAPAASS